MARIAPDGGTAAVGGAVFDDGSSVCERCGESMDANDLWVEVFEQFEGLVCRECSCALWEAEADAYDGQPDEAREWADFDPEC